MNRFAGCIVLMVVIVGCGLLDDDAPPTPPKAVDARKTGDSLQVSPRMTPLIAGSTAELRETLATRYRLAPDARWLRAVSDVRTLLTGVATPAATAAFKDGKWQVQLGDAVVGVLPDMADFPEALTMLVAWARAEAKTHPLTPKSTDQGRKKAKAAKKGSRKKNSKPVAVAAQTAVEDALLMEADARSALERVEKTWRKGQRNLVDLHATTVAAASLAFQSADTLEVADALPARALALLAVERAHGGENVRAEALLASTMGYQSAANQVVQRLPQGDALRLFVAGQDDALRAAASPKASVSTRYLWARRLARKETLTGEETEKLLGEAQVTLPVLVARLSAGGFSNLRQLGSALPAFALVEVAARGGDSKARALLPKLHSAGGADPRLVDGRKKILSTLDTSKGLLARFERDIQKLNGGPLLDAASVQAYYRGIMFSGLERLAHHYLDSLSSTEAAHALKEDLGPMNDGVAKEFLQWFEWRIQARAGLAVEKKLFEGLAGFKNLGGAPRMALFQELADAADYGDPVMVAAVQRLASALDSRPAHRMQWVNVVYEGLRDLHATERLVKAALAVTADPILQAWYAGFTGNQAQAQSVLRQQGLEPQTKVRVIGMLRSAKQVIAQDVIQELQALLDPSGDDWTVREDLVQVLEEEGRHSEAQALLEEWLTRKLPVKDLRAVVARTALARQFQAQGNLDKAWESVAPAIESWQFGALQRGALIRVAQGKNPEALQLAKRAAGRYPGLRSTTLLAEVSWRMGDISTATRVLAKPERPIRLSDWQSIGKVFVDVFGDRPVPEAIAAAQALAKARIDPFALQQVGFAAHRAGKHELAFEILSRQQLPGLGQLELLVSAYHELKETKDAESALAWIEKAVPEQMREPLSMMAHSHHAPELLWSVVPTPQREDQRGDFVWLMRAASSLQTKPDPKHASELQEHYQGKGASYYHTVGRYLLGMEEEGAALATVGEDSRRACEIAYYMGLRAESEKRMEDASDWYRASVEAGRQDMGEYRWAFNRLSTWYGKGMSLERLAKTGW